tara:strand:- start:136 stop:366 length:231 start_codon:yes stop_codon:yes gene_type:complete
MESVMRVTISQTLDIVTVTLNAGSDIERLTTYVAKVPPSTQRQLRLIRRKQPEEMGVALQHCVNASLNEQDIIDVS